MKNKKLTTFQKWLPFKEVLCNGIIKMKDNTYVKLVKVFPTNYNLKSEMEKQAILNSFKLFFKTCDFDFQILIQSTKEDFSKYVLGLKKEQEKEENKKIQSIYDKYINFISDKNSKKDFSSKQFIVVIANPINKSIDNESIEVISLNDKYYKVKEYLSRCGNLVSEFSRDEVIELLYSCFNYNNIN